MKKTFLLLSVLAFISACNTVQGMGRDIENAGEGISDSAKKVKEKINN